MSISILPDNSVPNTAQQPLTVASANHTANNTVDLHNKTKHTLADQYLAHTKKNIAHLPAPALLILATFAWMAYDDGIQSWALAWFAIAAVGLFGRVFAISWLANKSTSSAERKMNLIAIMNGLNGVIAGSAALFFPYYSEIDKVIFTLGVGMLSTGVVASNAGIPKVFLPYVLFTCLPLAAGWYLFPGASGDGLKEYMLSGMILLFTLILSFIARDVFKMFSESVEMQNQNIDINAELKTALQESESSSSAKTRFLATASHDLRQPVHTLSLLTASLMARQLDDKTQEIVQTMDKSLQSLSNQLNALLDISKLDAGIVTPNLQRLDIVQALKHLYSQLTPLAEEKGLTVSLTTVAHAEIISDATLLDQILRNLLSNAIKYSDQGKIEIILSCQQGVALVTIRDQGCGIAQEQKQLVFEEFYQIDNPHRDRSRGLGLGLSIVKRLVKMLGIELAMISALGEGTEFTLKIPLVTQDIAFKHTTEKSELTLDDCKVLIVDDEHEILFAMKLYLEGLGCQVFTAETSDQVQPIARAESLDLIIADFRLRNHDSGLVAIRKVREVLADLPAIVLTGDTAPDRLTEAMSADAALLHKPINVEELKKTIMETLSTVGEI